MSAQKKYIQVPSGDNALPDLLRQAGYAVHTGIDGDVNPADFTLLTGSEAATWRLQQQLIRLLGNPARSTLALVKLMRTFIPFDYCETVDRAFLRIGKDEYQEIDPVGFKIMTGMPWPSATKRKTGILDAAQLQKAAKASPVLKKLQDILRLQTAMHLTVGGQPFSFYSRQPDVFNSHHLLLLQAVAPLLPLACISGDTIPAALPAEKGFEGIIGQHPLMQEVFDHATRVAPQDTTVMLLGESGTGKELVAAAIHRLSPRCNAPFIRVNCASIPPELIESELFGYEAGAFTGAVAKRQGKFEQAQGGSIFLDEIGEMPQELQTKLLRVLQEKEIEPLGSQAPVPIDVRVITATHRDLEKAVAEGGFRADLFYRLYVFPITLPPLRHRASDIKALSEHFATRACRRFGKIYQGIAPEMFADLEAFHWPGNIRELENVITRAVILTDDNKPLRLLKPLQHTNAVSPGTSAPASLADVKQAQLNTEKAYIQGILKQTNGKIRGENGAAARLRLKPTTLESRMEKLGISKKDFR